MHRIAGVIFLAFILIIGFGLLYTAQQNLKVAPWAETARDGRLHPHLKNVTRIPGDAEAVRASIARARLSRYAPAGAVHRR